MHTHTLGQHIMKHHSLPLHTQCTKEGKNILEPTVYCWGPVVLSSPFLPGWT